MDKEYWTKWWQECASLIVLPHLGPQDLHSYVAVLAVLFAEWRLAVGLKHWHLVCQI